MSQEARIGSTTFTMPSDRKVVARRVFDAPRRLVWEAHTDPEHVPFWMLGPQGWTMPVCEIDLRPGGQWRYVWRREHGTEMEMTGEFREIVPPERLVYTEVWGGEWPESLVTLQLTEQDGRTTLTCTALYASEKVRDAALDTGMTDGWSAGYDRLDERLRAMV